MNPRPRRRAPANRPSPPQRCRLWLTFPRRLIERPVLYELGQRFELVTNIRQASVTAEMGIVCLELEGAAAEIARAVRWLERRRIKVETVGTDARE